MTQREPWAEYDVMLKKQRKREQRERSEGWRRRRRGGREYSWESGSKKQKRKWEVWRRREMSNRWGVLMPQWSERWLVLLSVWVSSCLVHCESLSVSNVRLSCGVVEKNNPIYYRGMAQHSALCRPMLESDLLYSELALETSHFKVFFRIKAIQWQLSVHLWVHGKQEVLIVNSANFNISYSDVILPVYTPKSSQTKDIPISLSCTMFKVLISNQYANMLNNSWHG